MKVLVAMCLMAVGVSAQWGAGGVVHPDGKLEQFTREQADNVAKIGPAGVVLKDGRNVQFGRDMAELHNKRWRRSVVLGDAGVITPGGRLIQFKHGAKVVAAGPSALILSDGTSVQYEH